MFVLAEKLAYFILGGVIAAVSTVFGIATNILF